MAAAYPGTEKRLPAADQGFSVIAFPMGQLMSKARVEWGVSFAYWHGVGREFSSGVRSRGLVS
jgi:hypothetical protein